MRAAQAEELEDLLAGRPRPVGVLDVDAVAANLRCLRERAGGKPIRVASKSLRVRKLLEYALATGGFQGVLAFTLREALWLAESGFKDLVVAYPCTDVEALRALCADPNRDQVTLMIDDPAHLDLIDAACPGHGHLRVAIELDASYWPIRKLRFGALRSPLRTPEQVAHLARLVSERPGFSLVGLMAYEGQIAGVTDVGSGPYARAVRLMKRRSAAELAERRAATVSKLATLADLEFVNGGGTGSFETTAAEIAVTELAAGSGIVAPGLFDHYRAFKPQAALHFGLNVVRRPRPGVVTLSGGGWIASGPPGTDRLPTIAWPPGLKYAPTEAAGEVQTPVLGPAADTLKLGQTVWLRHAKAGELAERLNHYVVVRRRDARLEVMDEWPTYRGEGRLTL